MPPVQSQVNGLQKRKYNLFVTPANNKIWAGALSLAWNELKDNIIKQDIKLDTQNQAILNIIQNFNKAKFTKNDLQESSYYVKSGYGPQTLETINKQVKIKFPNKQIKDLELHLNEQDIISYSYLSKMFEFKVAFEKLQQQNFKFKNKGVKGMHHVTQTQTDQLYYYFYENEANFLFGIDTKDQNQEVLFLKTDKNYTIDHIANVINMINDSKKINSQGLINLQCQLSSLIQREILKSFKDLIF